MYKLLLLTLITFLIIPHHTYATELTGTHLLISQVQITGGTGATNHDFIEIYNPTDEDIDLLGKNLVKRTKTGTSDIWIASWSVSTIIPAKKFYLLAHEDFATISATPDMLFTEHLANDNGLAIKHGSSTTIDSVAWGEAVNAFIEGSVFPTNPSANNAIVRIADTNDNSVDFEIHPANPRNSTYIEPEPIPEPEPEEELEEEVEEVEQVEEVGVIDFILINELFPNPTGVDSGAEFIELINIGNVSVNLTNWILDDGAEDSPIGSSHYKIPSGTISPGQLFLVTIPAGKFAMNNTGTETVRLFDPSKNLISVISYTGSVEAQSYSLIDDEWFWTIPTPGMTNVLPEEEEDEELEYSDQIIISRLLPEPSQGEEEWIELFNPSDEDVSLKDWVLADEARQYKIKDLVIPAGGKILIYKSQSKISLNNYGSETVTLYNPLGEIVSQVEYEDPAKNEIISFLDGGGGENLPRTGGEIASLADPWRFWQMVVIWFGLWYIYYVSNHNKYEQTTTN